MRQNPSPSASLLKWFRKHARDLPWRTSAPRDPYAVVVSEIMLQQTQVATVVGYYKRWMALFPDFAALAKARENRVLKAWEGLGYYNRASNLQKLAGVVVRDFGGELPRNFEALLGLPGIGPYSARSIGSIAFGMPLACVDGNVVRVLARVEGVKKSYASSSEAAKSFQKIADEVLDKSHPGEHNEAMMELGATICTKANPKCEVCPLKAFCKACAAGDPESFPKFKKTKTEAKLIARGWVRRGDRILLMAAPTKKGQLKGLYELPTLESLGAKAHGKPLLKRTRAITRFKITEEIFSTPAPQNLPRGLKWVALGNLSSIPLSGPHARWIAELLSA